MSDRIRNIKLVHQFKQKINTFSSVSCLLSILDLTGQHCRLFPWAFSHLEHIMTRRVLAQRCPQGSGCTATGLWVPHGTLGWLPMGLLPSAWRCLCRQDKCPHTRLGAQSFSRWEALQSHCRDCKNLDTLSVDVRSGNQKHHRPPPASLALLLHFGHYYLFLNLLHSCCGAVTLSQETTAILQWLQEVGKDVDKLDFTLLCWFIF